MFLQCLTPEQRQVQDEAHHGAVGTCLVWRHFGCKLGLVCKPVIPELSPLYFQSTDSLNLFSLANRVPTQPHHETGQAQAQRSFYVLSGRART